MNKNLLKLTYLIFCFSIIEIFVILYWIIMAGLTGSHFYLRALEWNAIVYLYGVPAFILFLISFITLLFSKWYKNNISNVVIVIIVTVSTIIFIAPFIYYLSFAEQKTYNSYLKLEKQNIILQKQKKEQQKKQECLEYKLYMSKWKEGDPMPTFDPKDCI